jgi:hypothetical protein
MAIQTGTRLVVYDPTIAPNPGPGFHQAPRLDTLEGKVVGLIDNSKTNSDRFLARVAELLTERYGVAQVITHRKPSASRPIAPDMADDLAAKCDLVVAAVGD